MRFLPSTTASTLKHTGATRLHYAALGVFPLMVLCLARPHRAAAVTASKTEVSISKAPGLTLSLSTNDPVGLFYEDAITPSSPVTLAIGAENRTGKAGEIRYEWKLTDYWGKVIRSDHSTSASIPVGGADAWYLSFHRDADLKGRTGIYTFQITARKGRDHTDAETAFGVIPRPAPGMRERSLFGVAAGVTEGRSISALEKIGARWLRTDAGTSWHDCEPTAKGQYDWDRFDRLASETRAHNLYLLPILDYAPVWAQPKGPDGKPVQYLDAPINVQDHADFMAAAVSRYAKEIKYWETWNEPYVMGWTWHSTSQHFRDMMQADFPAAKKANPDAVVIASGGSASHLQDVVFPPGDDMSAFVDEASSHTYGPGAPEEDFLGKAEHSVLVSKKHGKDRVWITEQGWTLGDSPKMAQYVPRTYVLAALAGVTQLDWFTLADDGMGLFKADFTPRGAAVSYAVAAHFLEDTILVRDLWPYSRRIFGAVFKNPQGRKTAVVWAVGDHGSIIVDNAKGVQAYDLMGGAVGRRDGDRLEVPLGEDAVYLESDGDQAAFIDQVQNAKIVGIAPVEVMAQPFLTSVARTPPIRVDITNMLNRPIDGDLEASPPKSWKLAQDRFPFGPLEPGATTTLEIPVRQSAVSPANTYTVSLTAVSRHRGMESLLVRITGPDWRVRKRQTLFLAAAPFGTPTIDGDLSDWADVAPLHMDTSESLGPWTDEKWRKAWTPGNLSALIYTRYDDANFYIAAKVTDNFHSATSAAADPYAFPFDGDSLQVAFGAPQMMNGSRLKPSSGPAANRGLLYDTDYEFSFALTPKGPEVYRLQTPESGPLTPYPTNPDAGLGLTSAVRLAAKRDDVNEVTTYEAAIPWTELRGLPREGPFHLAFKLNDRDREKGVEGWMESPAGAGELRGNELSFSPSWQYTTANLIDWTLLKR